METLTAKQARILGLKREGKTAKEIASTLGCSSNVIRNTLNRIYAKLDMKGGEHRSPSGQSIANLTEVKRPEQAAAFIDAVTDPFARVAQAMRECGLPESTGEALLRRLRTKYNLVAGELRAIKTDDIIRFLEERIHLGLQFLDAKSAADASWRDLSLGISAMVEKRNLLLREPTVVIDFNSRSKLNELIPAMIAEARRRGLALEGEFTHVVAKDSAHEDGGKG